MVMVPLYLGYLILDADAYKHDEIVVIKTDTYIYEVPILYESLLFPCYGI